MPLNMPITQTGYAFSSYSGGSLSHPHTISAGNNQVLFLLLGFTSASGFSSVQWNGTAMTQVGSTNVFYLINPARGSYNVTLNWSGGGLCYIASISYANVHQYTPCGTPSSTTGNVATSSITISSADDELVIDLVLAYRPLNQAQRCDIGAGQTGLTVMAGGTYVEDSNARAFGVSTEPGASSVTMSWAIYDSAAGSSSNQLAVAIKPAPPSSFLAMF